MRSFLRTIAILLGASHTTIAVLQQSMNEDGIGYLDMGDAFLRGDWEMAINGIWSPLYGAILGLVINVVDPGIRWEFPVAQITNFLIFISALFCFEFFWKHLSDRYRRQIFEAELTIGVPPCAFMVLGYSLFIWTTLNLIEIWAVTPDMLLAALIFLSAGLMVRLAMPSTSPATAGLLGATLGAGYLAKAALMPLGLACLLLTLFLPGSRRKRFNRLGIAAAAFLIVSGPLLVTLSLQHGKPMFSDVGRFTYMKHVNELRYPNLYATLNKVDGAPRHLPRRIYDDPPVFEFATPVGGTYPMAYDPAFWTAGLEPQVTLAGQLRACVTAMMAYFDFLVRSQGGFVAVLALLLFVGHRWRWHAQSYRLEFVLIAWSTVAFGMYSLVHVLPRYIAPFAILFWSGFLAMVRLPQTVCSKRLCQGASALLILFVWINIGAKNLEGAAGVFGFRALSEPGQQESRFSDGHAADHVGIAEALLDMGLKHGDSVGVVGYSFSAYWARLARLRIIAEIHSEDVEKFWQLNSGAQRNVLQAFSDVGVNAVIAEPIHVQRSTDEWKEIRETGYLLYRIDTKAAE